MTNQLTTREIFMRHTAPSGSTHVQSHWVWDAERFVQARQDDARKLNEQQEPGKPRCAAAEQITPEQFKKESMK